MTFSAALDGLIRGLKMARDDVDWKNQRRYVMKDVGVNELLSCRKGPTGTQAWAWIPTRLDLFADDWYIVVDP